MKFTQTPELTRFLKQQQLLPDLHELKEICTGGSSYNFDVRTAKSRFFLKLIPAERERGVFLLLKNVLRQSNLLHPLPVEMFEDFYILLLPYVVGTRLRYRDCTPELFAKIKNKYKLMQASTLAPELIQPQRNMPQMIAEISQYFAKDNSLAGRLLYKYFWRPILPELVCLEQSRTFIHGDLTANNILVNDGEPCLLDFEEVRYGYEVEDICYLFLQLSGFRGLFGRAKRFEKLQQMSAPLFVEPISQEYWLYGVQLFYLTNLHRRLRNRKKHSNLRKELCLLFSLRRYFRLSRFLHTV